MLTLKLFKGRKWFQTVTKDTMTSNWTILPKIITRPKYKTAPPKKHTCRCRHTDLGSPPTSLLITWEWFTNVGFSAASTTVDKFWKRFCHILQFCSEKSNTFSIVLTTTLIWKTFLSRLYIGGHFIWIWHYHRCCRPRPSIYKSNVRNLNPSCSRAQKEGKLRDVCPIWQRKCMHKRGTPHPQCSLGVRACTLSHAPRNCSKLSQCRAKGTQEISSPLSPINTLNIAFFSIFRLKKSKPQRANRGPAAQKPANHRPWQLSHSF